MRLVHFAPKARTVDTLDKLKRARPQQIASNRNHALAAGVREWACKWVTAFVTEWGGA